MIELKDKLIGGSSDLDVISIVGMAGLGKTTLANKLYFDESVISHFDIHARCCVSQEYTRKDLLLAILRDITDERARLERETEYDLADKLRRLLMRRRYIILIDDVWETSAWDDLKLCFPEDNNGSRIIMTTRHYEVASYAKHDSDPHKLRFLNSDESWKLLNIKVFNNESCPLILRDVDTIWKMVKLRHLQIHDQAVFTLHNEQEFLESPSKMDDLQTLSSAYFSSAEHADKILAKTPNLRRLRCEVFEIDGSFTEFNNLTKLEILKISSSATLTSVDQLKLPSHLKKLTLSNFSMHLNEVATLSNLKVLKLLGVTIKNPSLSEWDASDDAFPCLEHLVLKRCLYLEVIPSCFGYMPSLKSIEVKSCKETLAESAIDIKKQVEEMGFSDFEVIIHSGVVSGEDGVYTPCEGRGPSKAIQSRFGKKIQ
ncbi:hypothetical protein P3S68_022010 [Capsicum galapagoense]